MNYADVDLDKLFAERGERLQNSIREQAAALKLAKRGPWKPGCVVVQPRKKRRAKKPVQRMLKAV